ncbi:MAG: ATP-binding cassette domain-containing protein [Bacteroidales bacterium]|jgi:cell division transport system ATP-binding protein|nr:ATP-binding cassette domain-containing protein [Bacteroidales bacterium]
MTEIIHLDNASIYQKENLVLNRISLTVNEGEFLYLIGKTGSGKSSLLKTLYAELPLKDGIGVVAGYDLVKIRNREIPYLRRKLGIVFQDFQLLSDRSISENLMFVMKATGWKEKQKMIDRTEELLKLIGIPTKGYKMPHQLSGGEQQRVGVARALINHPPIILADEPTGNLDPESSEGILSLLHEISKTGVGVVMATHNYGLIQKFPGRIVRIDAGQLSEETPVFMNEA